MKKPVLLIVLMMSLQLSFAQQVDFGIRVGPSFTTFGGDASDAGLLVAFHAGLFAGIELTDQFVFEPGLQFARKGAKDTDSGLSATLRNDYLDVPLLFRYQTNEVFYVFAGPQPSLLLSSAVTVDGFGSKITITGSDAKELWKNFDFAAVVGFGVNVFKGFGAQLSYEHGLMNVSNEDSGTFFNRGFKLSVNKTF